MAIETYLKRGDTSPPFTATLRDANGDAVDLTGASARFHMRDPITNEVVVDASATITDEPNGRVSYSWQAADTARAGHFDAEIEVTYGDLSRSTFPSDGWHRVSILDDLPLP